MSSMASKKSMFEGKENAPSEKTALLADTNDSVEETGVRVVRHGPTTGVVNEQAPIPHSRQSDG